MQNQSIRFGFKETTKKDPVTGKIVKDEKGEPIKVPAHPPVVIDVPQFSLDIIGETEADEKGNGGGQPIYGATSQDLENIILSGDQKQINLILEAMNEVRLSHVKNQLDDAIRENKNVWPETEIVKDANGKEVEVIKAPADTSWLDLSKIEWSYIAALPPKQRGARGIPEETWEAFAKDYKAVIVEHGKTEEQAEAASKHFLNKFSIVRNNKKLLAALDRNLQLWYNGTTKQQEFQEVYQNLQEKLNNLLAADEDVLVASV